MGRVGGSGFVFLSCAALLAAPAVAAPPAAVTLNQGIAQGHAQLRAPRSGAQRSAATALISIILDDLGDQHDAGLRAVNLPGAVACAFLPATRFGAAHAERAHALGKEVLLHLPLQPNRSAQQYPTALTLNAGRADMAAYLRAGLQSVPHARGVNNHQGSLLTEMPQHMDWLMAEIKLHPGLYFVDSRTSGASIAYRAARARAVPSTERQVFLDSERGIEAVRAAFRQLIERARRDEHALAIGHPYPETFRVLEEELPRLAQYGVKLVAPSELIASQNGAGKAYKNLKISPALTLATTVSNLQAAGVAAR